MPTKRATTKPSTKPSHHTSALRVYVCHQHQLYQCPPSLAVTSFLRLLENLPTPNARDVLPSPVKSFNPPCASSGPAKPTARKPADSPRLKPCLKREAGAPLNRKQRTP